MDVIKVANLSLAPLQLYNVYHLKDWDNHRDPLYNNYNFPDLDDYEIRQWFDSRVSYPDTKSFAVLLDEEKTIGLINIKNIRRILKVANLGIVFNPKYIDQGYGTIALKAIIKHYFETMNMRSLYLDVAKHNIRAIRCYEKCGFKKVKKYNTKLHDFSLEEIPLSYTKEDFFIKDGVICLYCYKMRLGKKNYKSFI